MSLCLCVSVCHAHYSAVLCPFGKPEVSLEPYLQGHAIFRVSQNFTHVFLQFHAISRNFHTIWAISAIFGPISTCWVSKSMYSSLEIHWWYFHAISRMSSCNFKQFHTNFTQFSHNLGYFSHFWANFNMLGIKKHVLKPRNSLVIFSRNFTHVIMQFGAISHKFHAIFMQFGLFSHFFWPISTCWLSKSMYSSWEIHWLHFHRSSRTCSRNFMQISHNLGYFGHFWANFSMLGIKKHVLKLTNSLVVLEEVIGLKKGPKAPKKRPKASKMGRRPPRALRRS